MFSSVSTYLIHACPETGKRTLEGAHCQGRQQQLVVWPWPCQTAASWQQQRPLQGPHHTVCICWKRPLQWWRPLCASGYVESSE